MAGLQQAVNVESTLMLQYLLDQRDVKRLGLDLAGGLKQLHDQCQEHMKHLVSRLLFLEGAPTIEPKPALCAKISETPSRPAFSVGGGEGNAHEDEGKWYCVAPLRFGFAWRGAE